MDCSRLKLSIPNYRVSDDGTTHSFCNAIVYGKLKWEVFHRFSEYHALHEKLTELHLEAFQSPPPKLIGRPSNSVVLEERRLMLETWLRALALRPDIRTSTPFVDFIEFEIHTNCNVTPLAPYIETAYQDGRFQLSDFQWVRSQRAIFAAYEEGASMARLGKVWSLVEKEECGAISIFGLPQNEAILDSEEQPGCFEALLHTATQNRCRCLYFHEPTGRIFVGLETGVVEVYHQQVKPNYPDQDPQHHTSNQSSATEESLIADTFCGLVKEEQLNLHTESVLSLRGDAGDGPGRLLSVGFDKSVRVVNCTTLETICGGKLSKRLGKNHLTVGVLESASTESEFLKSRMFIGASNGSVFVFSSTLNPPEWIQTIDAETNSHPVTALELAGSNLLVAVKYTLSIYRVGKPLDPPTTKVVRIALYEPQLKSGGTIRSIAVAKTAPLLFLGHSRAISVWDVREGVPISVFVAHYRGVRRLCVLEDGDQTQAVPVSSPVPHQSRDIQLLSGGADGSLKLWRIRNVDEMTVWKPTELIVPDEHKLPSHPHSPVLNGSDTRSGPVPRSSSPSTGPSADHSGSNDQRRKKDLNRKHDDALAFSSSVNTMNMKTTDFDQEDSLFASREFTEVKSHRH